MSEGISWLIGRTDSQKDIRVYQDVRSFATGERADEYSDLENFQCYAALEVFSLYATEKYHDDEGFLDLIAKNIDYKASLLEGKIDKLKNRFSIITSIDLCNLGRKFLLDIFVI